MTNSKSSPSTDSRIATDPERMTVMARTIRKARVDPCAFARYLLMDPAGVPNSQRVKASRPLPIRVPKCPEPLPIHPRPRITSNGCSRAKSPARDRSNPHRLPAGKRLTARRRPP